jgi:hypothetical protein
MFGCNVTMLLQCYHVWLQKVKPQHRCAVWVVCAQRSTVVWTEAREHMMHTIID